ncbi:LysM peptidoglycan-binding domain-containing protein [Oscillibacter sp.]|uniref:LysM peptidoglycan-binding domain-containing protein n=1 Tax=Oscillibacter sp. TaxID=1945593 RepID=UPI00289FEE4A|nr:LysM peptidoglycan-binding domain-containing protein [Oscillibacter sp.]
MQFVFRSVRSDTQLIMPVTPDRFAVETGRKVTVLDMAQTGEAAFPGLSALFDEQLEFLLPSEARNYTQGGYAGEPYAVVKTLADWSEAGEVLRLIVTDTPVNFPVLLGPVRYGEQDGTGDVYVTLTLRRYRDLAAETAGITAETGNNSRSIVRAAQPERVHTVVKGDTLWGIARKQYGNGALCWKLATYNGIKNANLIYPGQKVRCPDKSKL